MKEKIRTLLTRSIDKIYPSREELERVLESGKKITVYLGVDPTGPHLHLGHATNLLVLKRFQELGHKIIFLIGDFTAKIGDPSDRLAARKPLSQKEVKRNFKTFKEQVGKIINFKGLNKTVVRFNSAWHSKMKFIDILTLAQLFTVQQMIKRDMFQKRLKENKVIGLHEFLYPLMQGYDSVAMNVDLEVGGTDQTFNMLIGRDLMRTLKRKEKFVLTTKLLENPKTGKKLMNKSEGGLINLDDESNDMFGKIMALPDETIEPVAEFCTNMPMEEVKKLMAKNKNPREAKMVLAGEIVKNFHSAEAARLARREFIRIFSRKETPLTMPILKLSSRGISAIDAVIKTGVKSKSEARRLIQQGAVEIKEQVKRDPSEILFFHQGDTVKIGKRRFFRIKLD